MAISIFVDVKNYFFYSVKPFLPRRLQLFLRRLIARRQRKKFADIWPINESTAMLPPRWKGWPNEKKFALLLHHDVDTQRGHDKCRNLMDFETRNNVKSTYFIVPERYSVSKELLLDIKNKGFGLGLHGLKHDGKLFVSYEMFRKRAIEINEYLREWDTKGFSSPSMHHRHEWMHHLNMDYCTSTFDTDPFEPQPDSADTIFPFVVKNEPSGKSFIELPYTVPQDFLLFIILREKTIDIWEKKIDWIVRHNGMVLINTHPDYMNFNPDTKNNLEEYSVGLYGELLAYVQHTYQGQYWNPLSQELADYLSKEAL
jgi:hypothetical protein